MLPKRHSFRPQGILKSNDVPFLKKNDLQMSFSNGVSRTNGQILDASSPIHKENRRVGALCIASHNHCWGGAPSLADLLG